MIIPKFIKYFIINITPINVQRIFKNFRWKNKKFKLAQIVFYKWPTEESQSVFIFFSEGLQELLLKLLQLESYHTYRIREVKHTDNFLRLKMDITKILLLR